MATAKKAPRSMSANHKAALAEGRDEGRKVRAYLEALEQNKPKRGRKRTPESMQNRMNKIEQELETADPLKRVQLVQERLDLAIEIAGSGESVDLSALEADFMKVVGPYSQRKGISYAAWREVGVAPSVLKAAGISRAS